MALCIKYRDEMIYFEKIEEALDKAYYRGSQDALSTHELMLDELKRQYNEEGSKHIGDLIRKIDPKWKSKWDLRREQDLGEIYCYECGIHDCIPHFN